MSEVSPGRGGAICYQEFPVSTGAFNVVTAGGLVALGAVVATYFGVFALVGHLLFVAFAVAGVLGTVCARCESYYGHRCGLGLGRVVPRFFAQKQTDRYLRTPTQYGYVTLLVVALVWPIVGGAVLFSRGLGAGWLVLLMATVALLMALAVPHPKLVCSHCRQGECGACPVGRLLQKAA
jgi:hypothetical protein